MRKRFVLGLALFLLTGLVIGCQKVPEVHESTIIIQRDGTVISAIRESFEEDYYDPEELEDYVRQRIESYNDENGDRVKLDNFRIADGSASLDVVFDGYEDYAAFNGVAFFVGKVSQAEAAGFGFSEIIAEMESIDSSNKVVIASEVVNVIVPGTIVYASSGYVEVLAEDTASIRLPEDAPEGTTLPYVYIIYR